MRKTDAGKTVASPGLTAGRGLKLHRRVEAAGDDVASPGLTAGRGLKLMKGVK